MSFVSTALSSVTGFVGSLTKTSQELSRGILGLVTAAQPLVELGTGIAGIVRGAIPGGGQSVVPTRPTTRAEFEEASLGGGTLTDKLAGLSQPTRPVGASALPGGAPVANIATSGVATAGLGGALTKFGPAAALALSEVLGLTSLGGNGAPARARMPKLLQVPGTRPGQIVTYVRAPQAIYKVTVRSPRRCRPR